MKKVSVVIPVYNVEEYIGQCLDSLLNQTLQEIEIICVDDGSTDSSLKILKEYEKKDNRISVVQQKNLFAGVARNRGMEAASGKYIIFLDSDDFFEPDMLKQMYEKCEEDQADVCVCTGRIYDETTQEYREAHHYLNTQMLPDNTPFSAEDIAEYIFNFVPPAPWNKLFRKDFIEREEIQFQNLQRTNDLCFVYTALACAKRITIVEKCFVNYRMGNANSLQATNAISPFDFYQALRALRNELRKRGMFIQFEKSFANRALDVCIYNLERSKTREDFIVIGDRLRQEILYRLGIVGHTRSFFYTKKNFIRAMEILEYSSEELWDIEHSEGVNQIEDEEEKAPLINVESWKGIIPIEDLNKESSVKVSVIVPVYNVEKYLRECLTSVVTQTLENIEIICVDDGSTDNSLEIVNEFAERDSRIKIVHKDNGGLSSARNAGLQVAVGEYVYFLDSDDFIERRSLEILYSEVRSKNLDQIFFSAVPFLDDDAEESDLAPYDDYYIRKGDYSQVVSGKELFIKMVDNGEFKPSACLQMNRREFLTKYDIKFVEGLLHEDQLFTMQGMALSERAAYINANLYIRRIRKGSIMTGTKEFHHAYGYYQVIQMFADFVEQYHLSQNDQYFNAVLKQLGRVCNSARQALIDVENDIITQELWKDGISEKEGINFYFCIYNGMRLKKVIANQHDKILQNVEMAKMYEYKRSFQVKDLTREKENLIKKVDELESSLSYLKKKANKLENSLSYKVGEVILYIPKRVKRIVKKLSSSR